MHWVTIAQQMATTPTARKVLRASHCDSLTRVALPPLRIILGWIIGTRPLFSFSKNGEKCLAVLFGVGELVEEQVEIEGSTAIAPPISASRHV